MKSDVSVLLTYEMNDEILKNENYRKLLNVADLTLKKENYVRYDFYHIPWREVEPGTIREFHEYLEELDNQESYHILKYTDEMLDEECCPIDKWGNLDIPDMPMINSGIDRIYPILEKPLSKDEIQFMSVDGYLTAYLLFSQEDLFFKKKEEMEQIINKQVLNDGSMKNISLGVVKLEKKRIHQPLWMICKIIGNVEHLIVDM